MPLDLIALLCFTFLIGVILRIHFTSISISEQTKISLDDPSAWITLGLVPGASLPYPILRQILPRFVDSILLIIDRQNSCHFPPRIHARGSAFHELHVNV